MSSAVASEENMDSLFRAVRNIRPKVDVDEFLIALADREADVLDYAFSSARTTRRRPSRGFPNG